MDGTVRRGGLAQVVGRSLLDLPVAGSQTLLDLWADAVAGLSGVLDGREVPCRLLVGRGTTPPAARSTGAANAISVEVDPSELRGTGGVLRDVAQDYADEDVLLVANAAQLLVEPLRDLAMQAGSRGGEVTVIGNADGAPASLMLVSCRALRVLPAIGFVDLKEQGLPLIAARHEVTVLNRPRAAGLPIRTAGYYLAAVRAHHNLSAGRAVRPQAFAERWEHGFSIIEPGARLSPSAVVHNSVVLSGARVDAHAVVADSVVCAGGIVRRREHIVRRFVTASGRTAIE
jgi:hypothetical protein